MLYNIIYVRMPVRASDLRRFIRAVQFIMIHQSISVALDTHSHPLPFLILGMAGSSPRRIFWTPCSGAAWCIRRSHGIRLAGVASNVASDCAPMWRGGGF